MQINVTRTLIIIAICAAVTFLERATPFIIFRDREVPAIVRFLGKALGLAIMTTLVVYCLKGLTFNDVSGFLPELIACTVTVVLHLWRRNTLISILGGTVTCMILTQFVF